MAPDGHPDRNLVDLQAKLLDHVHANAYPMPVTAADLDCAAQRYATLLHEVCGGILDLVHLGLGDDGHTASWAPGTPELSGDVALVCPYRGRARMTLTPAVVNRARRILWLVSGADKAHVLARFLEGDDTLPAARVRRWDSLVLADAAAALCVSDAS